MFKKLKDKLNEAVRGDNNHEQTLQNMGFSAEEARQALQATNDDVERAAELLLASSSTGVHHSAAAPTVSQELDADEQMRRVMEESRQTEENRRTRAAKEASTHRTAAMVHAGEAAARRFGQNNTKTRANKKQPVTIDLTKNGNKKKAPHSSGNPKSAPSSRSSSGDLSAHHPNIKVPAKLQDKSKEEQVLRCTDRLKAYPAAVDTLHKALVALRNDPANDRYRKVDKSTAGYKRSLADAPGAEGLLLAMNFYARPGTQHLIMERHSVDPALLYLGISALEGAKQTQEYKEEKRKSQFAKDIKAIQLSANSSETEAIKRADFMSKCPSEPTGGSGALMQVVIADETVRRRFDGDDVLQDVLNWIGGHGSIIPEKILSREWCLIDLNRYPLAPIDCAKNTNKTLQYIGCWPSGKLEIRPSSEDWKLGERGDIEIMGSSRGLGSAPKDVLMHG